MNRVMPRSRAAAPEVLEQHRADAAALVGVLDEEGHLGGVRLVPASPIRS